MHKSIVNTHSQGTASNDVLSCKREQQKQSARMQTSSLTEIEIPEEAVLLHATFPQFLAGGAGRRMEPVPQAFTLVTLQQPHWKRRKRRKMKHQTGLYLYVEVADIARQRKFSRAIFVSLHKLNNAQCYGVD